MGVNKVILVGNVGRDPEYRQTSSGTGIAKFSLATSDRRFKDQDGNPRTEWHNIIAWGRQAEFCRDYIKKGTQLFIEGSIRYDTYEKDGQKKYFTEIHVREIEFVGSRQSGGDSGNYNSGGQHNSGPAPADNGPAPGGGFGNDPNEPPF
jgi:single-strand DNA-binding protein